MNWKIPYIDFGRQFKKSQKEYLSNFKKIMTKGNFVLRDDVAKFEKNVAKLLKVKYVVGVNSCTDALLLSLGSFGFKRNSEIITVAHTYVATLAAIRHVGAKPVLADISRDYNIDVNDIEKLITKNTKAIVPVHLYGRSCNMMKIKSLAKKYKLKIIEDAAQAFGAKYNGKMVGTFGDVGCFSLHPLKSLGSAGDGGFIATNNKKIYEKVFKLRNHGQGKRKDGVFEKSRYKIEFFGFCSRLDNLQASIVNTKLKLFKASVGRRREVASIYSKALKDLPIILPTSYSNKKYFEVYNSYVIRTKKQKQLFDFLRKKKIEVLINWPVPLYKHHGLKLDKTPLPNSEKFCKEVLSLPIFPEITQKEINFIVKNIKDFFNK